MRLRLFEVAKDHTGSGLAEFTLVLPVLLFLVLGVAQFGLIFYNYMSVSNAAAYGARIFAVSRGGTAPYTKTVSDIQHAAPNLSGLTITLSVNNVACSSDSGLGSCQAELVSAYQANSAGAAPQESATVTVSYACTANLMPAYLINLAGICPLTATMQQAVE